MNKIETVANSIIDTYNTTDPFELCNSMNININYEDLGNLKGYTTKQYDVFLINLNIDLDEHERKFICFHELGHIVLEHNHNSVFLSTKTFLNVNKWENEANMFATHMTLAKYDKEELQELTIEQIGSLTGVNKIYLGMYFEK